MISERMISHVKRFPRLLGFSKKLVLSSSVEMAGAAECSDYEKTVEVLNTLQTNAQKTVEVLNTLQTNAQVLAEAMARRNSYQGYQEAKLIENELFLNRVGIKVEDIDRLKPIHIAGTKGKGSVCAMCESILRAHGYRTGFVSSPHLLEVRERIRINGQPINKDMFVKYFWECYNKFCETERDYKRKLPPYFAFLNVMSFKVFLEEKVDVAIVEVGIGGAYDATNIIRQPLVCGVTSLGYDHTSLLGKTLKEIAWHKAGIFKPGVPAFTTPQPPEGLEMIRERAKELKAASLMVSPSHLRYPNTVWDLGVNGRHQLENASLSSQICQAWLNEMADWRAPLSANGLCPINGDTGDSTRGANHLKEEKEEVVGGDTECGIPVAEPFTLPPLFLKGLQQCCWPGRCQVIKKEGVSYFIDGAHTNKSLKYCAEWFEKKSAEEADKMKDSFKIIRVLLFNFSGKRDGDFLMKPLVYLDFDHTLFCPNIIGTVNMKSSDQTNFKVCTEDLHQRCLDNALLWKRLHDHPDTPSVRNEPRIFTSISDAINWVGGVASNDKSTHVQVLVCGSLHLVGGVLASLGYNTDTLLQSNEHNVV